MGMGIFKSIQRLFGKTTEVPVRSDLSELSEKLGEMRGDNITVVDSGSNLPPNRDAIENLTAAARDARYIDRSNEDEAISNLRTYRKLK
jgi:hypothetical protein